MNIHLYAAAAAAVLVACAAAPASAGTGHVDIAYLALEGDQYVQGLQASGAYAAPVGDWSFSIDGVVASLKDNPTNGDDFYSGTANIGRAGMTGYYGAYVSLGSTFDTDVQEAGVLLQGYYTKWTATARAGIGSIDLTNNDSTIGGAVGLTYYPTENVAVGVTASMLQISHRPDAYTTRLDVEWQPKITPFSIFAGESWHDNDYGTSRRVMSVGVRYNFGAMSLKARDQSGGNLGTGNFADNAFAR
ncbi:hypothetical protein BH11PSE2_BH11PSE2_18980 [soil metagenome]